MVRCVTWCVVSGELPRVGYNFHTVSQRQVGREFMIDELTIGRAARRCAARRRRGTKAKCLGAGRGFELGQTITVV
ncbi:MAG: hypothetical protein V3V97_17200, partial [Hyphomicrobiaceae bacterium]